VLRKLYSFFEATGAASSIIFLVLTLVLISRLIKLLIEMICPYYFYSFKTVYLNCMICTH